MQSGAVTKESSSPRQAAGPRLNCWMFDRLRPWVGRRVLEIGAGIGNMSAFLVDRDRVVLTDTEPYYLGRLRERFADPAPGRGGGAAAPRRERRARGRAARHGGLPERPGAHRGRPRVAARHARPAPARRPARSARAVAARAIRPPGRSAGTLPPLCPRRPA